MAASRSRGDNRAARRRESAREMRALLEAFVAVDPLDHVDAAALYVCRHCEGRWTDDAPVAAADHRPDCLWRYASAWLVQHRPS